VEIESFTYTPTSTLVTLEAKFTFLEGENRRKRWVRNIYWGNGQLVFIAQGATVKEYDYWLPMFYNTMVTFQVS
jgi:aspartate/tyrosine/aromatic aminotransferase